MFYKSFVVSSTNIFIHFLDSAVVLSGGGGGYANGVVPQGQPENDSSNTTVSPGPLVGVTWLMLSYCMIILPMLLVDICGRT